MRAEVVPRRVGHSDDCLDGCKSDPQPCGVERKHFRHGGVCCLSCYSSCRDCGGPFYWEGLTQYGTAIDEDGGEVERNLCHCCLVLATGVGQLCEPITVSDGPIGPDS